MKITMTPVEKLSPNNFLSVCDVAMDILEELQMSTKKVITIPLLREVIRPRFNILMPGGDVNSGEKYCNYRLKAIEYLKANNYINDFNPSNDNFIFDREVEITVNREVFDKFYSELGMVYQKRVVEPAQKEQRQKDFQNKSRERKEEPPTARIEITGMPELQIKGFEEKVILQKPKNKRIQLRKFPTNTKWNDIIIQFLNDHEVIVRVKDKTYQTTYEEMGFQDEKKKLPNKQWQFLRLLAFKNGEISWENNRDLSLQQINSIKKQKQLLTENLKAYFQIYDDEPFYDYKKEKAYKIKLTLIPESNTKTAPDEQKIFKEDDELGIEESYKKQTPEIYEE